MVFCLVGPVIACTSDQIDVNGDGINCQTVKLQVGTSNIEAKETIVFSLSAIGTFYVDCGNSGSLSGTGVSGKTIIRSDATVDEYTCTYSTADTTKFIRFGGEATGFIPCMMIP